MAQAYYDEDGGQAQLMREAVESTEQAQEMDSCKIVGEMNHDKLCDAIHEKVISSEVMSKKGMSSLSLQERAMPQPKKD